MKIKIFTAATTNDLETEVNNFIKQREIDVIKMDFSTAVTSSVHMAYSILLTYKAHGLIEEAEGIY